MKIVTALIVVALVIIAHKSSHAAAQTHDRTATGRSLTFPSGARRVVAMLDRKVLPVAEVPVGTPETATKERPYENSLGMKFVPVPGTKVVFCIWETRVQDFEAFVKATGHDATQGMFSLRGGKGGQRGDTWKSPAFSQGPTHPVTGVNWEDAQAFCRWLSSKEGRRYRLPTDAEWSLAVGLGNESGNTPLEKSARIKGVYPWGNDFPPSPGAGNYAGTEAIDDDWSPTLKAIKGYQDNFPRTAPVGSFRASPDGLHDLGGNIWEWCEDWHDNTQKTRVLRGGSWIDDSPVYLLASFRSDFPPGQRIVSNGFRVVLVVGESR